MSGEATRTGIREGLGVDRVRGVRGGVAGDLATDFGDVGGEVVKAANVDVDGVGEGVVRAVGDLDCCIVTDFGFFA